MYMLLRNIVIRRKSNNVSLKKPNMTYIIHDFTSLFTLGGFILPHNDSNLLFLHASSEQKLTMYYDTINL